MVILSAAHHLPVSRNVTQLDVDLVELAFALAAYHMEQHGKVRSWRSVLGGIKKIRNPNYSATGRVL